MATLTQDEFVAARQAEWKELGDLVDGKGLHRHAPSAISRAASLYRAACADLMRARGAGYGADLIYFLDDLTARAHNSLYSAPPHRTAAAWQLFTRDFPRAIRKQWRLFALSFFLFFGPGAVGLGGALASRAFAAEVLPEAMLSQMEEGYSKGFDDGRDAGTNGLMAGFYVQHNVGIAFRCFACGVLFGLGSVFFLIYNGLIIGTVIGYVMRVGYGHNILTFVCGHSTFELTAIVIAGCAGMQMGYALVATGGLTRWSSLRAQAKEIAHLVLGAAAMLCIAAMIEGFWSPSSVPAPVKWAVSGVLALLVTSYFVFVGREPKAARA